MELLSESGNPAGSACTRRGMFIGYAIFAALMYALEQHLWGRVATAEVAEVAAEEALGVAAGELESGVGKGGKGTAQQLASAAVLERVSGGGSGSSAAVDISSAEDDEEEVPALMLGPESALVNPMAKADYGSIGGSDTGSASAASSGTVSVTADGHLASGSIQVPLLPSLAPELRLDQRPLWAQLRTFHFAFIVTCVPSLACALSSPVAATLKPQHAPLVFLALIGIWHVLIYALLLVLILSGTLRLVSFAATYT